jgi:transposase
MLRQMERSTIQWMAKQGKSVRQIAQDMGRNRRTVARVLAEPVVPAPVRRQRRSQVDPYREQIAAWIGEGLSAVRMLELARSDAAQPYTGSRSQFGEVVRRVRRALEQEQAAAEVPIRFEGLPGEYLQVDWGEIRALPFTQQAPATRYFLACRLKYSRWSWLRWTSDMRQETLFRGLVDCLGALGWVPWVLVFDNMKTVTSGRDAAGHPVWTPPLLQLAGDFGFHPQACDPGAGNQKGSVESLVKWVKGSFLPGRSFADDADLVAQSAEWQEMANRRPNAATGVPPQERLAEESTQGGVLPATARDYGLFLPGQVSAEALVAVLGNRYSVPIAHVGAPVAARVHHECVRLWRDGLLLAEHRRRPDGARQRVVDPAHFAPLFPRKPRAQAMLYREVLLDLGGRAPAFLSALSRRHRARLREEVLAVYALYERYGADDLLAAMALAEEAGSYSAAALGLLLAAPRPVPAPAPVLRLPGVPDQAQVDRRLSVYEAWVHIDVAQPEVAS